MRLASPKADFWSDCSNLISIVSNCSLKLTYVSSFLRVHGLCVRFSHSSAACWEASCLFYQIIRSVIFTIVSQERE